MEPDKDDMLSVKNGTALRSMDKFVDIIDHGGIFPSNLEKPFRSLVRTVAQVTFLQFEHAVGLLAGLRAHVRADRTQVDIQRAQIHTLEDRVEMLESKMAMYDGELDGLHKLHGHVKYESSEGK